MSGTFFSGEAPTPTAIKRLRAKGSDLTVRSKKEPPLRVAAPALSSALSKEARAEARRLIAETMTMRTLSRVDRGVIEAAAFAYDTWRRAEKDVAEEGFTISVINSNGYTTKKANPANQVIADAWRRYVQCLIQLGLTPAARTRVAMLDDKLPAQDAAEEYLQ